MAEVTFVVDPVAWREEFQSWPGTVGRIMTAVTEEVRAAAIFEAPKPGGPIHNRTGWNYATGRLASRITTEHDYWRGASGNRELEGQVISNAPYSVFVHSGTRPHHIYPRRAGHLLRFRTRHGVLVHTPHVSHPGAMANPFLERALSRAI